MELRDVRIPEISNNHATMGQMMIPNEFEPAKIQACGACVNLFDARLQVRQQTELKSERAFLD
jgi:hypothetical protein